MDNSIFNQIAQCVISGGEVSPETITACLKSGNHEALLEAAHLVTEHFKPARFDFCAIINARCGRCSENCKWCAQSAHWKTDCDCHGWVGTDEWGSRFRDLKWATGYLPQIEVVRIPGMMHGEYVLMHPQEFAAQALTFLGGRE